jgi:hypothetical protein
VRPSVKQTFDLIHIEVDAFSAWEKESSLCRHSDLLSLS